MGNGDETIFRVVVDDVFGVAEDMGLPPEEVELLRRAEVLASVRKGIESGLGELWHDVVQEAIESALAECINR